MVPSTFSRLSTRHANPVEPPISFDPQEEARIRLEQEIGSISLDLERTGSSSLSLEYGRHGAPSPHFEGVASFARYDSDLDRSRDASTRRSVRQAHSFRTVDDSYEGGNTQSTVAHHASALTVGAGLGYGTGPRPLSRAGSGAEYDPDRELSDMLKRRGRISVLDDTNTTRGDRNRSATFRKNSQHISSDPLIVDDTAELDRLLETGHVPEHVFHANPRIPRSHPTEHDSPRADQESQSSFQRSEADESMNSRRKPRLADALGGTFSPKRPRTTTTMSPTNASQKPLPAITSMTDASVRPSASLLASRPSNFPSGPLRTESSFTSSNGTQRARLEANTAANARRTLTAANAAAASRRTSAPAQTTQRQDNAVERQRQEVAEARSKAFVFPREPVSESRNRTLTGLSVHLPDMTGLTAAVESPSKAYVRYRDVQVGTPAAGLEEDRTMTNAQLEELSERLRELERENGTARRRVRELEMELEFCKAEVERERTRANAETERTRTSERQAANERAERDRRLRETEESAANWENRYREVVEEKQALEALVTTLRSHLARMTSEVEEHQRTIDDLRSMHERDASELEVKTAEVATITAEVERLAVECERLRGVVEEGLRERRQVREGGSVQGSGSQSDFEGSGSVILGRVKMVELSAVVEEEEEEQTEMAETEMEQDRSVLSVTELGGDESAMRSGRARTDRATLGSASRTIRFMDPAPSQSDDITPELERSQSSVRTADRSAAQIPSRSSTPVTNRARVGSPLSTRPPTVSSPGPRSQAFATTTRSQQAASTSRQPQGERHTSPPPEQRTPPQQHSALPQRQSTPPPAQRQSPPPASPPFPRIRGTQLEKLFFSAPEHNERTCTTCCGRRRVRIVRDDKHEPERARERERAGWRIGGDVGRRSTNANDDEGYVEGDEEVEVDVRRPPPQTVLVKVVRELEDDFAHYKAIYVELADQYRIIGPASNVAKRNVLAEHLKEVIDTLEKKGDQIASLYDLLSFNDKPAPGPSKQRA